MNSPKNSFIHVNGIVQGVGFRPYVYKLAKEFGLKGWVKNTSAGVDIELQGSSQIIDKFLDQLRNKPPTLAQIDSISVKEIPENKFSDFQIIQSSIIPEAFLPIPADVSTCSDCLTELFSPENRRYLYPFINCTNCGPRFTIITDIPYDRQNTTMAKFPMCHYCSEEYYNPQDRRFHAEPIACPSCGPHIWLEEVNNNKFSIVAGDLELTNISLIESVFIKTQQLLVDGKIIAIKGLGGFHLACDARNEQAIEILRARKLRIEKALAVMMPSIQNVFEQCKCSSNEINFLNSRNKPIVILDRKLSSNLPKNIAPFQNTLAIMLPYTPLHYLLFHRFPDDNLHSTKKELSPSNALIMTSGNVSEEPIAISNEDAKQRLSSIADYFLFHDRDIRTRCDDSVTRDMSLKISGSNKIDNSQEKSVYFYRRSRGYAPTPLPLKWDSCPILATGAELKNTFCISQGHYAFMSHHIGDLENYETLKSFEDGIAHFKKIFRLNPEIIAHDLHPNYLATKYAIEYSEKENLPCFGIQHHHAHIAACMVDNEIQSDKKVFGISFDGTGYGTDKNIWGGEFLLTGYSAFDRLFHLDYYPLPGGETSIKKPAHTALAYLWKAGIDWDSDLPPVKIVRSEDRMIIKSILENSINTPFTSSMGRLFDAVSALVGIRSFINYEAQAAIELESCSDPNTLEYYAYSITPFSDNDNFTCGKILLDNLLREIVDDYRNNKPLSLIGGKFHNTIAKIILDVSLLTSKYFQISDIALSGGVWQNKLLLEKTIRLLHKYGFSTLIHRKVSTNDAGVSLGQAAIAFHRFKYS